MQNPMMTMNKYQQLASDPGVIKRVLDQAMTGAGLPGGRNLWGAMDAATAGGMAFLEAELEKRDPKVREPLTSVTWMRDIVAKTGGGWVDFTSVFNVDYAISGPNMLGLMGGATNNIPIIQTNIGKDAFPVYSWANILRTGYVDMQKLQGIGRSLDDMLDKGVRLNWNKTIDQMVYQGFGSYAGLLNNSNITRTAVANGAAGSPLWNQKSPGEILQDVNTIMVNTVSASQYDVSGMCNHILIPWSQYAYISSQLISAAGTVSILTYLLENNIGKTQGVDLQIYPCRWCAGAGQSGTDRMIGYVNDEDRLYFDITVPIQRAMTQPSVQEAAYLTLYMGQIGVPKFLYTTPVAYADGL